MTERKAIVVLLIVIACALVAQTAMRVPWSIPVAAQAQVPRADSGAAAATFRSVIFDRYRDVATAERSMQLRLMEGYEVIAVQVLPESVGQLDADKYMRVGNLDVAPINTSWVVIYGRR